MKLSVLLSFAVGIVAALESDKLSQLQPLKRTARPSELTGDFTAHPARGIALTTRQESRAALQRVPVDAAESVVRRRGESLTAVRQMRRQVSASDFYECSTTSPAPNDADCQVIANSLKASSEDIVVAQNACLTFSFATCQGFFCSLCGTLQTSTDFIGNQLDLVEGLCVANGQSGTIVSDQSPQWDAGFVVTGSGLPSYDVC
ncbi:hypothetical protein B0T24DRAFT_530403 [Lasiosphaeria ovina]|uniref:Uncharacterized protein n=1 Tax=Lasiosphaeria ovina TaxID=92902 RepID=A0AAE0N522_9PEZI|nr:hypothetical protein B0T24DRAFT_530403 [Lasiosphaeria ovina]